MKRTATIPSIFRAITPNLICCLHVPGTENPENSCSPHNWQRNSLPDRSSNKSHWCGRSCAFSESGYSSGSHHHHFGCLGVGNVKCGGGCVCPLRNIEGIGIYERLGTSVGYVKSYRVDTARTCAYLAHRTAPFVWCAIRTSRAESAI